MLLRLMLGAVNLHLGSFSQLRTPDLTVRSSLYAISLPRFQRRRRVVGHLKLTCSLARPLTHLRTQACMAIPMAQIRCFVQPRGGEKGRQTQETRWDRFACRGASETLVREV